MGRDQVRPHCDSRAGHALHIRPLRAPSRFASAPPMLRQRLSFCVSPPILRQRSRHTHAPLPAPQVRCLRRTAARVHRVPAHDVAPSQADGAHGLSEGTRPEPPLVGSARSVPVPQLAHRPAGTRGFGPGCSTHSESPRARQPPLPQRQYTCMAPPSARANGAHFLRRFQSRTRERIEHMVPRIEAGSCYQIRAVGGSTPSPAVLAPPTPT